jgi:hypothetical protein
LAASYAQQFADADFEGCPCEPTLTFPECPQHAVLGIMLADSINGTSHSQRVCERYLETFAQCGFVDPDTRSFRFALRKTAKGRQFLSGPPAPWADGWTGAFMAAWAPEYIDTIYPTHRDRHLPNLLDRRRTGVPPHVADATAGLGYFAVYAAKVGDAETVRTLLEFADRHYNPTWRDGACYYPRNDDARISPEGVLPMVSALAGNALIPFARLLGPRGLWSLHNRPWTAAERARPCIVDIDDRCVGVAQAQYIDERASIHLTLEPGMVPSADCRFGVQGLRASETVTLRDISAASATQMQADARGYLALNVDARRSVDIAIQRQA